MKNIRLLAKLAAFAMVFVLALTGCTSASTSSTSNAGSEDNVLRVGMECAYAPFNWTQQDDANGAVAISGDSIFAGGYDVEIAKKIAEQLGRELVIVKSDWDGLVPSLTSGKIDLIIAGMSATKDRMQTIDFSDHYYTSDLVIVVRKDSEYANATSIKDFSGAKITGQLSTLHYDVIDQIEGVDKQPALLDFPVMIVALSSGKIDGYVSERPGALSAVASNPDLTFVGFEGNNGFDYESGEVTIAVGLTKGSEIKDAVNKALATISEEERIALMDNAVKNQPLAV